jgi:hypothetical protein
MDRPLNRVTHAGEIDYTRRTRHRAAVDLANREAVEQAANASAWAPGLTVS